MPLQLNRGAFGFSRDVGRSRNAYDMHSQSDALTHLKPLSHASSDAHDQCLIGHLLMILYASMATDTDS